MNVTKTTMELPEALFRQAKAAAAVRGTSFRDFMTQALTEKLRADGATNQPWLQSFGKLRRLSGETARINQLIQDEFGQVEPEDRQ